MLVITKTISYVNKEHKGQDRPKAYIATKLKLPNSLKKHSTSNVKVVHRSQDNIDDLLNTRFDHMTACSHHQRYRSSQNKEPI